jgi:hypothetical protein
MKKVKLLIQSEIQKANTEKDALYLLELTDVLEYIETCEFMRAGTDRAKTKVVVSQEIDDQIPF